MDAAATKPINIRRMTLFARASFLTGAAADLLAAVPLLIPEAAKAAFGLEVTPGGGVYLYASRVGASLMLGWTCLLVWGSLRPIERRGLLLLTVVPVIAGLFAASVAAVGSGAVRLGYIAPIWGFYAFIVPLYVAAYIVAGRVERGV